jgi:hypothetical protein
LRSKYLQLSSFIGNICTDTPAVTAITYLTNDEGKEKL